MSTVPTEWAIAPSHSANGHSMLMSNSHLEWRGISHILRGTTHRPRGDLLWRSLEVGFPVASSVLHRTYVGWTQTTNNPNGGDLYNLTLKDIGYILDGKVCQFEVTKQNTKVRQNDGTMRDELLTIRRSEHGPLVVDQAGTAVALRVTALDRPWSLRTILENGPGPQLRPVPGRHADAAAASLQYCLYATRPRRPTLCTSIIPPSPFVPAAIIISGLASFPATRLKLIWDPKKIVPYDQLPKVIDPPTGCWIQNSNDTPWTSAYPRNLDSSKFPLISHRPRALLPARNAAPAPSPQQEK